MRFALAIALMLGCTLCVAQESIDARDKEFVPAPVLKALEAGSGITHDSAPLARRNLNAIKVAAEAAGRHSTVPAPPVEANPAVPAAPRENAERVTKIGDMYYAFDDTVRDGQLPLRCSPTGDRVTAEWTTVCNFEVHFDDVRGTECTAKVTAYQANLHKGLIDPSVSPPANALLGRVLLLEKYSIVDPSDGEVMEEWKLVTRAQLIDSDTGKPIGKVRTTLAALPGGLFGPAQLHIHFYTRPLEVH